LGDEISVQLHKAPERNPVAANVYKDQDRFFNRDFFKIDKIKKAPGKKIPGVKAPAE
jgi:hypothetical protein